MRTLVACSDCGAQFDAGTLAPGSFVRCSCGAPLAVPTTRPHDAKVVRCSACGGARSDPSAKICTYCSASFTLREMDLDTVCPGCFTRIQGEARFCHSCGLEIDPIAVVSNATELECPTCGGDSYLASRRQGQTTLLECPTCGGLWLSRQAFEELEREARSGESHWVSLQSEDAGRKGALDEPIYRPCPVCSVPMHRKNYQRRSGVIVDWCAQDGIWFDRHELDRILRWVRDGGARRAEARDEEERKAEARTPSATVAIPSFDNERPPEVWSWIAALMDALARDLPWKR